jgi:hypothetical protein
VLVMQGRALSMKRLQDAIDVLKRSVV